LGPFQQRGEIPPSTIKFSVIADKLQVFFGQNIQQNENI
jgi:hypothetical protein